VVGRGVSSSKSASKQMDVAKDSDQRVMKEKKKGKQASSYTSISGFWSGREEEAEGDEASRDRGGFLTPLWWLLLGAFAAPLQQHPSSSSLYLLVDWFLLFLEGGAEGSPATTTTSSQSVSAAFPFCFAPTKWATKDDELLPSCLHTTKILVVTERGLNSREKCRQGLLLNQSSPSPFVGGCGVEAGRGKSTKVRKGMDDAWRRSKQKEEEGG
jgi:hypothetical protein